MKPNSSREHEIAVIGTGLVRPETEPTPFDLPFPAEGRSCLAYQCPSSLGKGFIPPARLRRLGRTQKLALVAAKMALDEAGISCDPDPAHAVCMATGLGELGETEGFLESMLLKDEEEPKPTKFTNSVHNSIAAQIAILHGFKGENHTFTQGVVSFELALWQAQFILRSGRGEVVLVCGADELSPYYVMSGVQRRWWKELDPPEPLQEGASEGSLPGEGAAALVLARKDSPHGEKAKADLAVLHVGPSIEPSSDEEVAFIKDSLEQAGSGISDLDLLLLGIDGNKAPDGIYLEIIEHLSRAKNHPAFGIYKHLCGEYCTASALGISLAAQGIGSGRIPLEVKSINSRPVRSDMKQALIYHISRSGFHSLCLLRA